MSIAQGLCLQSCIAKKLRRDKNCLRKSIAHKNLREKLQPLVMKAEERQSMGEEELDPAMDEACTWLKIERNTGMALFKERVAMGAERLAALTLDENGEE
ncbi:hypothetical protein CC78DRAFT_586275 [Lojkania enalia]|uniref:Uncharacterized protein n=1 Tax=Lojkania enalia TaxID=147567 RepID=A0A9P4JZA6_9PLEO|nr:hypothetical protein CC78DRAFT_586275 [Didymosphaeria enalia]